jgi:hypothetical protein
MRARRTDVLGGEDMARLGVALAPANAGRRFWTSNTPFAGMTQSGSTGMFSASTLAGTPVDAANLRDALRAVKDGFVLPGAFARTSARREARPVRPCTPPVRLLRSNYPVSTSTAMVFVTSMTRPPKSRRLSGKSNRPRHRLVGTQHRTLALMRSHYHEVAGIGFGRLPWSPLQERWRRATFRTQCRIVSACPPTSPENFCGMRFARCLVSSGKLAAMVFCSQRCRQTFPGRHYDNLRCK